jgi:hypothetical protein
MYAQTVAIEKAARERTYKTIDAFLKSVAKLI